MFNFLKAKKDQKTMKSIVFTYYIPAPPKRKTGYREKEFDKAINTIISANFEILDIKMQSNPGVNQSGLWILFVLRPKDDKAKNLDIEKLLEDNQNEDLNNEIYHIANDTIDF